MPITQFSNIGTFPDLGMCDTQSPEKKTHLKSHNNNKCCANKLLVYTNYLNL